MNNLLHTSNNSNISKISNQHIASSQPVFVVCIPKIMHNSIKAAELQTVMPRHHNIYCTQKHFDRPMITTFKFIEAISSKAALRSKLICAPCHRQTDRSTDRQTDDNMMPIAVQQYDPCC